MRVQPRRTRTGYDKTEGEQYARPNASSVARRAHIETVDALVTAVHVQCPARGGVAGRIAVGIGAGSPASRLFEPVRGLPQHRRRREVVGPDLAGVNDKRPEDWLLKFIKSSQALVKSGDKTATRLLEEFNKMPIRALSESQIKKVLAHIKEAQAVQPQRQGSPGRAGRQPHRTPTEIQRGQDLFEGKIRFANGGPSCNACHHVTSDAVSAEESWPPN